MLTIGSLFSGIVGLELCLEWTGLGPVVWQCEIDPFCRAVLAKHWPGVTRYEDVTAIRRWPHVDLVCGGFPCQDVSSAGGRAGLGGKRSGLWYHFAKVVEQVRPPWVVVENVASGASRWLRPVRHHLHLLGYRTRALGVAASDVGAPHRRKRVFVVAYADRDRKHALPVDAEVAFASAASDADRKHRGAGLLGPHAGAERAGWAELGGAPVADPHKARREGTWPDAHEGWSRSAAEPWRPPVGGLVPVVHGLPGGLAGRRRRRSVGALGNAVVPQCAQVVGWVIQQMLAA